MDTFDKKVSICNKQLKYAIKYMASVFNCKTHGFQWSFLCMHVTKST